MPTRIEWTEETWNPVTGCSKISPGCKNCYAERMAFRWAGLNGYPERPNHFDVTLHPGRLENPLRWRKPRQIFACSMSDLFHEDVPFVFIEEVWLTMRWAKQHTFQVLTKRPKRASVFMEWFGSRQCINPEDPDLPYPNIWLGVSVENPDYLWRVDELVKMPAALHFVSLEPILASIDLCRPETPTGGEHPYLGTDALIDKLDWVIVGAESGPGRRDFDVTWALDIYRQCQAAGVPFFGKQDGGPRPGAPLVLPEGIGEIKQWPATR